MSPKLISAAVLLLFIADSKGLKCFHCIYLENVRNLLPDNSSSLPFHSSCGIGVEDVDPSLRIECSTLLDSETKSQRGIKNVVGLVNGAFTQLGNNSLDLVDTRKRNVTFTCAKLTLNGIWHGDKKPLVMTIRSCIPAVKTTTFKEKCYSGELEKLVSNTTDSDHEVSVILNNFLPLYDNKTKTNFCTCNQDDCNKKSKEKVTTSNSKSGSEKVHPQIFSVLFVTFILAKNL